MFPIARNHQNRVVARQSPHHIGKLRAIDDLGQRIGLARPGSHDDELLNPIYAACIFGYRSLERGFRARRRHRFRRWTLVGAVSRPLDQAQIADIPRQGGLRHVEALRPKASSQLFLAVNRFAADEIKNRGLALSLHIYSLQRIIIHT
jgi:hypothetical protein